MIFDIASPCDAASDNNGKLNLMGTFDMLFPTTLPFDHIFYIGYKIRFEKKEPIPKNWTLEIIDPEEKSLLNKELSISVVKKNIDWAKSKWNYVAFSIFIAARFEKIGEHKIRFKTGEKIQYEIFMDVVMKKAKKASTSKSKKGVRRRGTV